MRALAYRRGMGIAGVLLLLASLFVAIATPALADPIPGNCNPPEWSEGDPASGPWGTITDNGDGSVDVNLNAGYSLDLCVKGGSSYNLYSVSTTGNSGPYLPPETCGQPDSQCGLSHWAIRIFVQPTTTVSSSTTSSSTSDSTTTTVQSSTTSGPTTTVGSSTTSEPTTTVGSSTTSGPTTTVGSSTTVAPTTTQAPTTTSGSPTTAAPTTTQGGGTTPAPTTTTTIGSITTQGAGPTTSGGGADGSGPSSTATVLGIQVTAPVVGQVTQVTLPFTGLPAESMAVWAGSLALLGLLLLAASRGQTETIPGRSWE